MSALEKIFEYLMLGEMQDTTEGYRRRIEPSLRREAQTLYDAVAHELAEKIRDAGGCACLADCNEAHADLIDPEVSSNG